MVESGRWVHAARVPQSRRRNRPNRAGTVADQKPDALGTYWTSKNDDRRQLYHDALIALQGHAGTRQPATASKVQQPATAESAVARALWCERARVAPMVSALPWNSARATRSTRPTPATCGNHRTAARATSPWRAGTHTSRVATPWRRSSNPRRCQVTGAAEVGATRSIR
jgi:hypothetical protein